MIFTGFQLQSEKFLQLSDMFVICSETEGCPNALLEAMSSQLPIIASSIVSIEKILSSPNEALLFPPGDIEALQRSLRYLLNHPQKAKGMALAARKKILNEYSFEKIAPKYHSFYLECATFKGR